MLPLPQSEYDKLQPTSHQHNKYTSHYKQKKFKNKHMKSSWRHYHQIKHYRKFLRQQKKQRLKSYTKTHCIDDINSEYQQQLQSTLDFINEYVDNYYNAPYETLSLNEIQYPQKLLNIKQDRNSHSKKSTNKHSLKSLLKINIKYWLKSELITLKVPEPNEYTTNIRNSMRKHVHQAQLDHIQLQFWNQSDTYNELLTSIRIIPRKYRTQDNNFWVNDYDTNLQKISEQSFDAIKSGKWGKCDIRWTEKNKVVLRTDYLGVVMEPNNNEFVARHDMRIIIKDFTNHKFDGMAGVINIILWYLSRQNVHCLEMKGEIHGECVSNIIGNLRASHPKLRIEDLHHTGKLIETQKWICPKEGTCTYSNYYSWYTYLQQHHCNPRCSWITFKSKA